MCDDWNKLMGKGVRVELCAGGVGDTVLQGTVYTVDPVSNAIVLVRFSDDVIAGKEVKEMTWVPRHGVKSLILLEKARTGDVSEHSEKLLEQLFRSEETRYDPETINKRREMIVTWLRRNHVDAKVRPTGEILIFGSVLVEPPYSSKQCRCDNPVVLNRVRTMIDKCPLNNSS